MDYGERTTGTRDEQYNLVSVLYHALNGAESCDRYASDAEISGDEYLAAFFRETQAIHTEVAERAKGILGINPIPNSSPEPDLDVGTGAMPDDALVEVPVEEVPVAEVPADVPEEVTEPTVVRVPPDDLGTTIRALEGGPEELSPEEALDEIDGWRLWLEGSADPALMVIASDLGRLGDQLRSGAPNPAEVGSILGSLGERVRELAESDVGAPVADELRILGGLLNTAGRDLPG